MTNSFTKATDKCHAAWQATDALTFAIDLCGFQEALGLIEEIWWETLRVAIERMV